MAGDDPEVAGEVAGEVGDEASSRVGDEVPDEVGLVVRAARPGEHDAVGELTAAAYVIDGHNSPTDGYVAVLRDAHARAAHGALLVAVSAQGRLLGTVTLARHGSELAKLAGPGEVELRMLGTDPATRGRGVGRALVEAAIERARQAGASGVVLCTMPSMLAARRLYERLGFHRDPTLDREPLPGLTVLGYRLALNAAGIEAAGIEAAGIDAGGTDAAGIEAAGTSRV